MPDYTKMYYKTIGKRMDDFLKNNHITLEDFSASSILNPDDETDCGINPYELSRIKNGIIYKQKNPYLLSVKSMKQICKGMNTPPDRFIWGSDAERETMVKLIILAVLLNGNDLNPFYSPEAELLAKIEKEYMEKLHIKQQIAAAHLSAQEKKTAENKSSEEAKKELADARNSLAALKKKETQVRTAVKKALGTDYQFDIDLELLQWAQTQNYLPDSLRENLACVNSALNEYHTSSEYENREITLPVGGVMSIKEAVSFVRDASDMYFSETYGFFYSKENYELYENIRGEYQKDLEELSNLILRQLMNDYDFTHSFADRTALDIEKTNRGISALVLLEVKEFQSMRGKYGSLALDNKGAEYFLFIKAFYRFWEKQRGNYMNFFNTHVFSNKKLNDTCLRSFQNKDFHKLITSEEFLTLNRRSRLATEYTDPEAMLSIDYLQTAFRLLTQKVYPRREGSEFLRIFRYLNDTKSRIEQSAAVYSHNFPPPVKNRQ